MDYTIVGRNSFGTDQIAGDAIIRTTLPNETLEVENVALFGITVNMSAVSGTTLIPSLDIRLLSTS